MPGTGCWWPSACWQANDAHVSFEVDNIDETLHRGWSILVQDLGG